MTGMAIKLFDRITMLLKADAHGLVESLEERSLLLKQYVREAEIELNRKRARLEAVRDEERRLRETLARREAESRALDEDITLALAGAKEELARFAIRRLLPRRSEIQALRAEIEQRSAEGQGLSERLERQQAQFDALRTRTRVETARAAAECADTPCAWLGEPVVADEEVELELLRRRRSLEGGQ
jgi:phage shock protein A